ncbi:MAG: hypothetical protein MZV64_43275 [Ignavibacteriales bacterium]|nr:hypothetical protein [Ignavibacteriales bacterium]
MRLNAPLGNAAGPVHRRGRAALPADRLSLGAEPRPLQGVDGARPGSRTTTRSMGAATSARLGTGGRQGPVGRCRFSRTGLVSSF